MYTVYRAEPVISMLYLMMAKYECVFVGSSQLNGLCASAAELNSGMFSFRRFEFEINLEL